MKTKTSNLLLDHFLGGKSKAISTRPAAAGLFYWWGITSPRGVEQFTINHYIVRMGILESLPPDLITFLTWFLVWLGACVFVLTIAVMTGPLIAGLLESVFGWWR